MKKTVDEKEMVIFAQDAKIVLMQDGEKIELERSDPETFTPVIRDGVLVKTYEELLEWEENADD